MSFLRYRWYGLAVAATWIGFVFQIVHGHTLQKLANPIVCRGGSLVSETNAGGNKSTSDAEKGNATATLFDGPGDDLRVQADSIIDDFERELIRIRQEIAIETEEEMVAICEAALERRKAELHERHRSSGNDWSL